MSCFISNQHRGHVSKHGGYSLIEIAIVVGVIAILSLLLTATIGPALENSRAAKCIANLRQLSAAVHLYAGDNRNELPPFREYFVQPNGTVVNGTSWRGLLIPYLPDIPFENRGSRQVLDSCPTGWKPAAATPYTYYYAMTADSISAERKKLSSVSAPSQYFLLGDSTGAMRITQRKYAEELAFRHNERANLLFLDGHIEGRSPLQIPSTDQENTREFRLFWTGQP